MKSAVSDTSSFATFFASPFQPRPPPPTIVKAHRTRLPALKTHPATMGKNVFDRHATTFVANFRPRVERSVLARFER